MQLLLSIVGICIYAINCVVILSILSLIYIRTHSLKSNISLLLICNNYLTMLTFSCTQLLTYTYYYKSVIYSSVLFNGKWCQIRTYVSCICLCSIYHSFILQATFRLYRIVFYKHKILQSIKIFSISILIQWLIAFLFTLSNYLLNDFQYISFTGNCWISFVNIRGLLTFMIVTYNNPLTIIINIYVYVIRYIKRTNTIQQRRQLSNKRDLIILKRIVLLLFVTIAIGLPSVIVVVICFITKYVYMYSYDIQGLSISIGILIASMLLILINPDIKQVFHQNRIEIQEHQTITIQINQRRKTAQCE